MRPFSRFFACLSVCLTATLTGCSGSGPSDSSPTPTPTPTAPTAAALTITSVAPTKVPAGSSTLALTVNGTGFQNSTLLQVGGAAVSSQYVSSTQLTATVPAKAINNGAQLSVIAANGSVTSATETAAVKLEVDNPVPQISGFSPVSLLAGSGSTTLSVTGTGFVPSTVIQVNGSTRPTGFVSATQVNLTMTDADLATGGALGLLAFNPAPAGGTSAAASVPVNFPAPGGITIVPSAIQAATKTPTTVTVTGTNFVGGSVALVNGSARATTVISSTQLTFALLVSDEASQGTENITVNNPAPGGGASQPAVLTVTAPPPSPSIQALSPEQLVINTPTTLYISGSNLDSSSVVNWNGTPLQTNFQQYGYYTGCYLNCLSVYVTADLLTAVGTANITVTSPNAPEVSNTVAVNIVNPPVPTVYSLYPTAASLNTATTITVAGKDFTSSSTIQLDGISLTTSFQGSGTLTAPVSGSSLNLPGAHTITVQTPGPGGGVSSGLPFTSYVGLLNTAMALNPVNGILYVSVPKAAGAPYGNTIVPVDPATGAIGTPIPVGSEPGKLAISADGTTAWVALDAASAVRKVDLLKGTAGMQFSLGGNQGAYSSSAVVQSVAVLPNSTTSIVVGTAYNSYTSQGGLTIYDNGVARPNSSPVSSNGAVTGISTSPTKSELYTYSSNEGYKVLKYDAKGFTQLASNTNLGNSYSYGNSNAVQVDSGKAYLDSGQVVDAEAGTLLGTFYINGTTVATGPMVSDSSLGKNFILTSPQFAFPLTQSLSIQAFNESDQTLVSSAAILVTGVSSGTKYTPGSSSASTPIDTMVRWGQNGLAFRGGNGIFSFRSNMVKDLSTTDVDLKVSAVSPLNAITGKNVSATVTVSNSGPSAASSVAILTALPDTLRLVSATPSQGSCAAGPVLTCDLDGLGKNGSATIKLTLEGLSDGDASFSATAISSENDTESSNNTAISKTTFSGGAIALAPTVTTLSPMAALVGSQDLVLTVTGSGFTSASTVNWNGAALSTAMVNATQLTATIPASSMASLGWAPITVSTPAPGGGTSSALPFTVFNTLKLQANHLAAEPFTGRLYATVNSAATEVTGNSVVVVDPVNASLGTPVTAGSQPNTMAFSDDGKVMYIGQTGGQSVGCFNVGSQTLEFSFPVSVQQSYGVSSATVGNVAVLPGTENTVAVDLGNFSGTALYDVDPVKQTATSRVSADGQNGSGYGTGAPQFLNNTTAFAPGGYSGGVTQLGVTAAGFTGGFDTSYALSSFGTFQLLNGIGYADQGGVADLTVTPPAQKGVFLQTVPSSFYYPSYGQITAADPSLGRSFFALSPTSFGYNGKLTLQINAFDQQSYLQTDTVSLPYTVNVSKDNPYPYTSNINFVRWGQDGLAVLVSDGQIVLLRGGFVVPGLLTSNKAASLGSVSKTTITHGSGNAVLSVTGSGFVPGVGVFWNGAYRTTTLVDAAHLTFDIPASDVAAAGSAKVTVVNPNAAASSAITVTIN